MSFRRVQTMAKSALIVLVAATVVLVLSAGNVGATDPSTAEHVLSFYLPPPATIIAGPGAGSTNGSDTAFGSLEVFDIPILTGPENTSKSLGRSRGAFLVDSYDGFNTLLFFTLHFTSGAPNGSVIISGDFNVGQTDVPVPVIAGSEEFSGISGYMTLEPILPKGPATRGQLIDAKVLCKLHYTLPRP